MSVLSKKNLMRAEMKKVRRELRNRQEKSQQILAEVQKRFLDRSKTICIFVSKEPEVETQGWIQSVLKNGEHTVVVPYCEGKISSYSA